MKALFHGLSGRSRALISSSIVVAAISVLGVLAPAAHADGVPLKSGNVLVALGDGKIGQFTPAGVQVDTLDTTSGSSEETGMCFDSAGNLYTTNFEANSMSKFDKNGNLVAGSFGTGFNQDPESCVVNQSNQLFVGQADGSHEVLQFDLNGNLKKTYSPTPDTRGTDWIDLEKDGHTLHYTSEGSLVKTYDTATSTQGPDFASGLPAPCFAHRILADGGEVVACSTEVVLLDSSGHITKTYPVDPNNDLFALSIDPSGKSFWTADFNGTVWNVDLSSGTVLHTWNAHPLNDTAGMVVVGELTVSSDPAITATGTAIQATEGQSFTGTVATFSDADTSATSSEYSASIKWGDGSTSTGTITGSGGSFTVSGTHTYAEEGSNTATVTITDVDNTSNAAAATSPVTVADAALSASAAHPKLSGTKASGKVATFTDANAGAPTSDFKATINWGDGKHSSGNVAKSGGKFTVSGSHTYGKNGTFTVKVTITDEGGSTATVTLAVTIARPSAHLSGVPAACVLMPFTVHLKGKEISSVRFTLDGARISGKTVHGGTSYSAKVSLSSGNHTLVVKVTFKKASHAKAKTFTRTVSGCAAVLPVFTG